MKIGLVSAILEDYDFKKMIDTVSEIGYECVEVACWPKAKAERRYAGVSHIDVANLGDKEAEEILSYCKEKNVEISSLAFYPNTMDGNLEKRAANMPSASAPTPSSPKSPPSPPPPAASPPIRFLRKQDNVKSHFNIIVIGNAKNISCLIRQVYCLSNFQDIIKTKIWVMVDADELKQPAGNSPATE